MELINMSTSREESDKMSLLYEASYRGCVSTLNSLIQRHPQILYRISPTSFTETPLHISALLGHVDFTKALLTHNPKLSLELDSSRSTPLHLASAEGHIDIVKELVKLNNEACLFADEEGRIPLHYAAMRGRTEVARELTKAKTESLSFLDKNGKTALHLCVPYNHLETLKALVELELHITGGDLLNFTGSDCGNTILHLAVMLKQVETTRYLLSISKIRGAASMKNEMGFTVHDILERSSKDLKNLELQLMLMRTGIKTEEKGMETQAQAHPPPPPATPPKDNCCIKTFKRIGDWFKHKDHSWLEVMRGNLSLVATVISTITFQALINPPGGFIQQGLLPPSNTSNPQGGSLSCSIIDGIEYCPGEAISSHKCPLAFSLYLTYITICFFSSLFVTLLLVSGFPLKNKAMIWMLSLGMCVTLTFLSASFFVAAVMVVPEKLFEQIYSHIFKHSILAAIGGLLWLFALFISIGFSIWIGKKCIRAIKLIARRARNHNGDYCCFV